MSRQFEPKLLVRNLIWIVFSKSWLKPGRNRTCHFRPLLAKPCAPFHPHRCYPHRPAIKVSWAYSERNYDSQAFRFRKFRMYNRVNFFCGDKLALDIYLQRFGECRIIYPSVIFLLLGTAVVILEIVYWMLCSMWCLESEPGTSNHSLSPFLVRCVFFFILPFTAKPMGAAFGPEVQA